MSFTLEIKGYNFSQLATVEDGKPCLEQEQTSPMYIGEMKSGSHDPASNRGAR